MSNILNRGLRSIYGKAQCVEESLKLSGCYSLGYFHLYSSFLILASNNEQLVDSVGHFVSGEWQEGLKSVLSTSLNTVLGEGKSFFLRK